MNQMNGQSMNKLKEEYESETMRVVFKDAIDKTNVIQILKQFCINKVVSI